MDDLRDEKIKQTITKYMALRNVKTELIMKVTGMKRSYFYQCKNNPSRFRLSELRAIYDFLEVPQEEKEF